MKVYVYKDDPTNYQIFPEPEPDEIDKFAVVEVYLSDNEAFTMEGKCVVAHEGDYSIVPLPPNEDYSWDGSQWVLDSDKVELKFEKAKVDRLIELKDVSQAFIDHLTETGITPEFERQTWEKQEEEANAWKLNTSLPTPTLEAIATLRGVPVDVLREKAYKKARMYRILSRHVTGERQAFEDRVKAAKDMEQLAAIDFHFTVPKELSNGE